MKPAFQLSFNGERLTKLAKYLSSQSAPLVIDALEDTDNLFNTDPSDVSVVFVCQNMLQALPKLFAKEWRQNKNGELIWTKHKSLSSISSIIGFFGLENVQMFSHLFGAYGQSPERYSGVVLTKHSTTRDMAVNIAALIIYKNQALDLPTGIEVFISKN